MTAALTPARQQMRDTISPRATTDDARPIVTIDLDRAEIVTANAPGSKALGLFEYASFPTALDPSTPALARLRELAALGCITGKSAECLKFWNNGQLRSVRCTITREVTGGPGVFVLHIIDQLGVETPSTATPPHGNPKDAGPTAPHANPGIAETSDKIARDRPESNFPTPAQGVAEPQRTSLSHLDPDHLAKLAHELKTPLTAIAAAAEVMRDERLGAMGNSRYLTYAADIHENAAHALDVIATLLSESGRANTAVPRLIALDLNAIVERTVSSVQALAQSRGLTLAFEAEERRPHVVANPTSLRQILLNLLTNAIKFTPPGGDIRAATGYLSDGRVFLTISDTGPGITETTAAQTESKKETAQPWLSGSGIGLPLVQHLVRDMSAEIEIDSAPGKGTEILITFGDFARWPT